MERDQVTEIARLKRQLAEQAEELAIRCIVHTDLGIQYCSVIYQSLLSRQGLTCSMSSTGTCIEGSTILIPGGYCAG